jgi:putative transposase
MGLETIYRKPRASVPGPGAQKYPHLLRERLVAVMDWRTRAVLSWRLSNTLEGRFCLEAFEQALRVAGTAPEIFNTDQGSQFSSEAWIVALKSAGVRVSMDGK